MLFFQMTDNPWDVDSIQAFLFFKCPECIFDTKESYKFQEHAVENHPLSFVLFGKQQFDEEGFNHFMTIKEEYEEEEDRKGFNTTINIKVEPQKEHIDPLEVEEPTFSSIKEEKNVISEYEILDCETTDEVKIKLSV